MAISKDITERNQIALASVAGKKDIDKLVVGKTDNKLMSGWRHEMLGQHLSRFLQGEIAVTCQDGKLDYQESR